MQISKKENKSYFLGVDGGGSKTVAIVVDGQGRKHGRGQAGSSNRSNVGFERAVKQIQAAVEEAAAAAGCQLPLRAAWFGLAGVDRAGDESLFYPHLRSLASAVHVTNDAGLILSALDNAVGVVLIAGTGSVALGRDAHGNSARAGGWGHLIGDEGSGYELGRLGLQAAVRASDSRGPATVLLDLIMQYWNLEKAEDIIEEVYPAEDKARIARLSGIVFKAARDGDALARELVERAANELVLAALAVSRRLDFAGGSLPVALGGGLLVHEEDFRAEVLRLLSTRCTLGEVAVVAEPALSAARAAIRLAGMSSFAAAQDDKAVRRMTLPGERI
jgi:glucosamine kinase